MCHYRRFHISRTNKGIKVAEFRRRLGIKLVSSCHRTHSRSIDRAELESESKKLRNRDTSEMGVENASQPVAQSVTWRDIIQLGAFNVRGVSR
jgi:hypothetical protein